MHEIEIEYANRVVESLAMSSLWWKDASFQLIRIEDSLYKMENL